MDNFLKIIFMLFVFSLINPDISYATSTEKYWQEVEEALQDGLPKTAIERLNKILAITQKEDKLGEWLTALTQKIVLEATIEGNKPEEKVKRLKKELASADANTKPLLQAILAHWYWHYYNQNRYRFMQRTPTENFLEDDFTTWDLKKIFREIDLLYQNILKEEKLLTSIPVEKFLDFLEPGNTSLNIKPTLYDFIAQEAINFYTSAEQSFALPEDAFEIDAGSDAFGPIDKFLNYRPATEDTNSPKYKAIIIYQSLMNFHKQKKNTEAILDLDIQRLRYIKNICFGEDKDEIYIKRLGELMEEFRDLSLSSLVAFYLAKAWAEQGDLVKAYKIAQDGYKRYPDSYGGKSCNAYCTELTSKSLRITGEKCIPPGKSKLLIVYKNFTKLYFRIYPDNWDDFMKKEHSYPNAIDSAKIWELLSQNPVKAWEIELDSTDGLKEKALEIDIPELKPGYYRVFVSWEPDFKNSSMVQHTWLWVSNLSLITRMKSDNTIDGFVLDVITGEPVEGVEVQEVIPKDKSYVFGEKAYTDTSGYFQFRIDDDRYWFGRYLYIKKGNDKLFESNGIYTYGAHKSKSYDRTIFFTDRSLYRPGQTIYFKGICVHIDQEGNNYEVIPNRRLTVYFRDVNDQEIEKIELTTNDFGSFSGQFIAPVGRLTGTMSISTNDPLGSTSFSIEEYKRPKFTVEIEKPKEEIRLNQEVEITGKAIAYTGAPVDNAEVRYTVKREASYPYWWFWYYPYRSYSSTGQYIAHGRTKTDASGNFKITFFAKPDPKISPENDPIFRFTIHADVTSPDGETRSADAVISVGYKSLTIKLSTKDKPQNNKEFSLNVTTQTLDGNNVPAKVKFQVFRLREPQSPIPARYWENILKQYASQNEKDTTEEFSSNWMTWPKDRIVYETEFTTEKEKPKVLRLKLPSGLYKLECFSKDKFGNGVKAFLPLMVLPDFDEKHFTIKLPSVTQINGDIIEVGKNLEVFWGTGYKTGRCIIEIEHNNRIIKRYWTDKSCTQHTLIFPVGENLRGGFVVHLTYLRENRAYINDYNIYVPWDNKELLVSFESFRDKLNPGERERYTLKIKGKKNFISVAEMVATMYDFSLDQFYAHSWSGFNFFKRYYSFVRSIFVNGSISFSSWRNRWNPLYGYPPERTYIHFPEYVARDFLYYTFTGSAMVSYSKKRDFEGEYGRIQGRVIDAENGDPLIGADVLIEGTELGGSTDETGHFTILYVPEGTYSLTASYLGYDPYTIKGVKSIKGKTTTIKIRLKPSVIGMEKVIVSAERPSIVVSQTQTNRTLVSENIARLPVTTMQSGVSQTELGEEEPRQKTIDLKNIEIRRNLNETAFFYPHLLMEKDGTVKIEFKIPEALTKWKFLGFAHGKGCENGIITEYAVTQKELMVQPNPPRFLREGDTIFFTAKVVNMSDKSQKGIVQIDFKDLITEQSMNNLLGLKNKSQNFDIEAHTSQSFSWMIFIPKGMNPLTYTVVAKSQSLSDGETGAIPVLSSRIYLTESFPFHIRGPQTKNFTFDRLNEIYKSETAEPFRFTVQMVSNPSWYAIQSLPYLIESPFECSEKIFNRLYANSLAGYIANSNPKIREIFNQWKGNDALKSNLEKNQDLKSVLLIETPWVIQAQTESQAKRNVGILFEENTLNNNLNSAFTELKNIQLPDGSWPWFPGGRSNPYITLYITTGFGRLRHLGVKTDISLALRAIDYLDHWIDDLYDHIIDKSANNLSHLIAFYLYGRSFFLKEKPIPAFAREAVEYFLNQSEQYWLALNSRLSQGYLSLGLERFRRSETAKKILASIKERSVQNEEMGMFWREDELSWWWYRAPIETQALIIEAFSEVLNDTIAVEDCKVWLLKQKQTQHWKTTKATADVVYALLLRGQDYLSNTKLVKVKLGNTEITPQKVEAGTNFYEKVYLKDEILPEFSDIKLTKEDKGIAWGGFYFQYFEDMSKVTPYTANLQLEKKLFVNRETKEGKIIEPLKGPLKVGDLITVRIVLRVDRDMEYVHLKDLRGSGLEPVDVLSGYRYQDGLMYYQSTRDVATHFFIDYLPKGTYVFQYDLRVQHKGFYQSGIAEIQCMYAPEFSSHSQSQWLEVE